jgi:hypothetical protein
LDFDPKINEYVLLASCKGLSRMGEDPAMEELAFIHWLLFSSPDIFDDREALLAHPRIHAVQQFAPYGKKVFLQWFELAWQRGLV